MMPNRTLFVMIVTTIPLAGQAAWGQSDAQAIQSRYRTLVTRQTQIMQRRSQLQQQKNAIDGQRQQILQQRNRIAAQPRPVQVQTTAAPDLSQFRCPISGVSWYECEHSALKQDWLDRQQTSQQQQFRREMERIMSDLQDRQASLLDDVLSYNESAQSFEQERSRYESDLGELKQEIKAIERLLFDEKAKDSLGALSRQFETADGDAGTVSSGTGDAGGVSYGIYQMSSTRGTAEDFVKKFYPNEFKDLAPGTSAFNEQWQAIADQQYGRFGANQHKYIKQTHYDPLAQALQANLQLEASKRSDALQNALWSTAVQHGSKGAERLIEKALEGVDVGKAADRELLEKIYGERGRTDDDGNLVYFKSSSKQVQSGVAKRFETELQNALEMLND